MNKMLWAPSWRVAKQERNERGGKYSYKEKKAIEGEDEGEEDENEDKEKVSLLVQLKNQYPLSLL